MRPQRPFNEGVLAWLAEAMRVLLSSFYFPPAGGGGVQRPLKFAAHLSELGVETHVLAPEDPRWIHRDEELAPPPGVVLHRARYIGPRGRKPAEELRGVTGLELIARKLALTPRRLLVPDEDVPWTLTAVPTATRIVRREGIDVLLTTSPPSSIHLVGAAVKRLTGVRWVADMRDSMVANPDRPIERLVTRLKEREHERVARLVARYADAIVAVTETIAAEARARNAGANVAVIPNGCDFEDFEGLEHRAGSRFRITHTGSFFGARDPRPFLTALAESDTDVVARFAGDFRGADREWVEQLGLDDRLELHPYCSHRRALALQRDSEALLLLLPEVGARGRDVPSGKLYEYLAARRPILAAVPPEGTAAALVREAEAGVVVAPGDVEEMRSALGELYSRWQRNALGDTEMPAALRERLSRRARAEELIALLEGLVAR
ncbi:MAG: glycosyltransferase family 4 protein [Actinobacteria bacterium]|nr:MAG: glycosyltransferase family 4 protein [Actinomycetota bacterium]